MPAMFSMCASALAFTIVFFLAFALGAASGETLPEVRQAFYDAKIPQDLHISFDPSVFMEVEFPPAAPSNISIVLQPGMILTADQVALEPQFGIAGLNASLISAPYGYVLVMLDLDAPLPHFPVVSPFRHFLGGSFFEGLPDSNGLELMNKTAAVTTWLSPAPLGAAAHRYVFLTYIQSEEFVNQTLVNGNTPRGDFDLNSFAQEVKLGEPVGGTYMFTRRNQNTSNPG